MDPTNEIKLALTELLHVHEISIAATASSPPTSTGTRSSWTVQLKNEAIGRKSDEFTLRDPFALSEYESIQWYLEDFAVENPFANSKAKEVTEAQTRYGQQLVQALQPYIDEVLAPPGVAHSSASWGAIHLLVHGDGTKSSLHCLLWELIERINACNNATFFTTTRIVASADDAPTIADVQCLHKPFRILYVSARPGLEEDIAYRAVSRHIWSLVKAQNNSASNVELHFVRPSTWGRFLKSLKHFKEDYFDLVHFDMHGTIGKSAGKDVAYLHFASAGPASADSDRKAAPIIARYLAKYRIRFVILNACNSASPGASISGNLACVFASYGMQYVAAMQYMTKADTAPLAMRSMYSTLLQDRTGFLKAVRCTRAILSALRSRTGRFGMVVECEDEFNLVCYARRPTSTLAVEAVDLGFTEILELQARGSHAAAYPNGDFSLDGHGYPLLNRIHDLEILALEEKLEYSKLIFVHGDSGTGKTALSLHIHGWWTETRFAREVLHFSTLSSFEDWLGEVETRPGENSYTLKSPVTNNNQTETGPQNHGTIVLFDNVESYDVWKERPEDFKILQTLSVAVEKLRKVRSQCHAICFTRLSKEQVTTLYPESEFHNIHTPSAKEASALTTLRNHGSLNLGNSNYNTVAQLEDVSKIHHMNLTWIQLFAGRTAISGLSSYEFLDALRESPEHSDFDTFREIIESSNSSSAFSVAHERIQSWFHAKDDLCLYMVMSMCMYQGYFPQDPRNWFVKLSEIGYFSSSRPLLDQLDIEKGEIRDWALKDGWGDFENGTLYEACWTKVKLCLVSLGLAFDEQKMGRYTPLTRIHPLLPYFLRYEICRLKPEKADRASFWRLLQQSYWEFCENRSGDWSQAWLHNQDSRIRLLSLVQDDSENLFEALRLSTSQHRFPFRRMRCYNLIHWLDLASMGQAQLMRWALLFGKILSRYGRILADGEWHSNRDGRETPSDDHREQMIAQAMGVAERLTICWEQMGSWKAVAAAVDDATQLATAFLRVLKRRSVSVERLLYTMQVHKAKSLPTSSWSSDVLNYFSDLLTSDIPDNGHGPTDEKKARFWRLDLARHVSYHLDLVPSDHLLRQLVTRDSQASIEHISVIFSKSPGLMQFLSSSGADVIVHRPPSDAGEFVGPVEAYKSPEHMASIVGRMQKSFHTKTPSANSGYITDAVLYAMDPQLVRQQDRFFFNRARLREVYDIAIKTMNVPLQVICLQQLSKAAFLDGDRRAGERYRAEAEALDKSLTEQNFQGSGLPTSKEVEQS